VQRDGAGAVSAATSAPKVLRVGLGREPDDFLGPLTSVRTAVFRVADAGLTAPGAVGETLPILAAEVPSLENGTWRVFPDNTMEVTWKLRPNARWQDGHPMTSDDVLFFFEYLQHPQTVLNHLVWTSLTERVVAPDPHTLVVTLKSIDNQANVGHASSNPLIRAIPRHILGLAFAVGDVEAVTNSVHWREEFIGLGPYRLVRWERGSRMEFTRFDDYVLGRPPLDRLILGFFPDSNALTANLLADELDVLWEGSLTAEQGNELRRRWEGTSNTVLLGLAGNVRHLLTQHRPSVEVRPAALRERAVRQAILRAIDRPGIGQVVNLGLAPVPDSYIPREDPRRQHPAIQGSIVEYPYDPARAQRELEGLGWRKGADGLLVNASGERFEFEVQGSSGPEVTMLAIIGDSLRGPSLMARRSVCLGLRTD